MPKQKPTGFIARCPWCGMITGAMDYTRTDRKEAGTMLGQWLMTGHVVEPRFHGNWSVDVQACQCNEPSNVEFSGSTPLYGGESAGKTGSTTPGNHGGKV